MGAPTGTAGTQRLPPANGWAGRWVTSFGVGGDKDLLEHFLPERQGEATHRKTGRSLANLTTCSATNVLMSVKCLTGGRMGTQPCECTGG